MGLSTMLAAHRLRRKTPAIAQEIARRCESEVWNRVRDQVTTMSLSEARGYIGARAGRIVRQHVAAYRTGLTVDDWAIRRTLITETHDAVVGRVLGILVRVRVDRQPARRAA